RSATDRRRITHTPGSIASTSTRTSGRSEITPTTASPFTTTRWRTSSINICAAAATTDVSAGTVTGSLTAIWPTGVVFSKPRAIAVVKSRSVTMPVPSSTSAEDTLASRMTLAAPWRLVSAGTHTTATESSSETGEYGPMATVVVICAHPHDTA